jgi:hypothetical protein
VILKHVRYKRQFSHLARQVYLEYSVGLYTAYVDATKKTHGYLLLDRSQDTDERLRFRTHIFPDEEPPVIYTPPTDDPSNETIQ